MRADLGGLIAATFVVACGAKSVDLGNEPLIATAGASGSVSVSPNGGAPEMVGAGSGNGELSGQDSGKSEGAPWSGGIGLFSRRLCVRTSTSRREHGYPQGNRRLERHDCIA